MFKSFQFYAFYFVQSNHILILYIILYVVFYLLLIHIYDKYFFLIELQSNDSIFITKNCIRMRVFCLDGLPTADAADRTPGRRRVARARVQCVLRISDKHYVGLAKQINSEMNSKYQNLLVQCCSRIMVIQCAARGAELNILVTLKKINTSFEKNKIYIIQYIQSIIT